MDLSREVLEREIEGSENAILAHREGEEIHKIVLSAFKAKLAKLHPKVEKKKEAIGV